MPGYEPKILQLKIELELKGVELIFTCMRKDLKTTVYKNSKKSNSLLYVHKFFIEKEVIVYFLTVAMDEDLRTTSTYLNPEPPLIPLPPPPQLHPWQRMSSTRSL